MALIFKADQEMTAPPPGTPMLPDITSALALDYAFDSLRATVSNGSPIIAVPSTGQLGINLDKTTSNATKPSLIHNGPGGHAALSFAGTNLISTGTGDGSAALFASGQELTFVLVAKISTVSESVRILGVDSNPTPPNYRFIKPLAGGGVGSTSTRDGSAATSLNAAVNIQGQWTTIVVSQGTGGAFIKVGNRAVIRGAYALGQMHGLRLGATGSAAPASTSFFTGEIARVQVHSKAFTEVEAAAITTVLAAEYGIAG